MRETACEKAGSKEISNSGYVVSLRQSYLMSYWKNKLLRLCFLSERNTVSLLNTIYIRWHVTSQSIDPNKYNPNKGTIS